MADTAPPKRSGTSISSAAGPAEPTAPTKKPKDTAWRQQELPACKPVMRPFVVVVIFLVVCVIFIAVGGVCLAYGLKAKELSMRYDDFCTSGYSDSNAKQQFLWQNAGTPNNLKCTLSIEVQEDMDAPIYLYYEIRGMYQNHRRYVRSHMDVQLAEAGNWQSYATDETQAQNCQPLVYWNNTDQYINPCGLVAWTNFNDTYEIQHVPLDGPSASLTIQDKGIAFKIDTDKRFANYTTQNFNPVLDSTRGGANITTTPKEDQRFQNWMRLAHMSTFRKLWGKIDTSLKKGDLLQVTVMNQYNTYSFQGKKFVVLSTTTWLGGRSIFLGVAYLVAGGLALIFALLFWLVAVIKPRPLGDVSALTKKPTAAL